MELGFVGYSQHLYFALRTVDVLLLVIVLANTTIANNDTLACLGLRKIFPLLSVKPDTATGAAVYLDVLVYECKNPD